MAHLKAMVVGPAADPRLLAVVAQDALTVPLSCCVVSVVLVLLTDGSADRCGSGGTARIAPAVRLVRQSRQTTALTADEREGAA
jgi:hypothetical protein